MDRFRLVQSRLPVGPLDSWGIELALRAIEGSRVPVLPTLDGTQIDHTQYLAYWHSLHYLAVARLGWRYPGRGFRSWRKEGRPSGDKTLDFIWSVWGKDATLDIYVAWATLNWEGTPTAGATRPGLGPSDSALHWARNVRDKEGLELLFGGWNLPHFGDAGEESQKICDKGKESVLTVTDPVGRRGVYITGATGFYEDLTARWRELPDVAPNDWRIDVFNRGMGFLGTHRLSRSTGRLFVGRHKVHLLGN